MKSASLAFAAASLAVLLLTACGHLDMTPPGEADRVVNGTVASAGGGELPGDAEVWVRVLDLSHGEDRAEVLGEQTIKNPGAMPVPFHIEYRAEDQVLRGSVVIDARVSAGRRLLYITAGRHPITLSNFNDPHTVVVEPALKP